MKKPQRCYNSQGHGHRDADGWRQKYSTCRPFALGERHLYGALNMIWNETCKAREKFDANASEVLDYILGLEQQETGYHIAYGISVGNGHSGMIEMSRARKPEALHTLELRISICSDSHPDFRADDLEWLVKDEYYAKIVLKQWKLGECYAELYVRESSTEETLPGFTASSYPITGTLLDLLWNEIVENWESRSRPGRSSGAAFEEIDEELELAGLAKQLGIRARRLKRWDSLIRFKEEFGLTQEQMADRLKLSPETIKKDFAVMRRKGYWPRIQ